MRLLGGGWGGVSDRQEGVKYGLAWVGGGGDRSII